MVDAGPPGVDVVSRLLEGEDGIGVGAVSSDGTVVRVSIRAGSGEVDIELGDPGAGGRFFLTTERLGLRYGTHRGLDRPDLVATRAFDRLKAVDFGELLARLRACQPRGEPFSPGGPSGPGRAAPAAVPSRLDRFYRRVDRSGDWFKFSWPERAFLDSQVEFPGDPVRIQHGTLECGVNGPMTGIASLRYFAGRDRMNARPGKGPQGSARYVSTVISQEDVLAGRTFALLRDTMIHVVEQDRPSCLNLSTTCLPELIGDNPTALIREVEQRFGTQVFWTSKTRNPGDSYQAWLRRTLEATPFSADRDDRLVVVAGLLNPEDRIEAERLLSAAGIAVAGHLLPSLGVADIEGLPRVRALVWGNPNGWHSVGDEVFRGALEVVRSDPPMGLKGTAEWLSHVAAALGLSGAGPAVEEMMRDCERSLEPIRREAGALSVGLIGDRADLDLLLRKEFLGYSVGFLLCEIGFNVKCLVYDPDGSSDLARPATPVAAGTVEFVPFDSRPALDRLIADRVDLAFSHLTDDPRLSAHGVRGFCEGVFDLGLTGLLRAGRRLLDTARLRWPTGHRKHLTGWV